MGFKLGMVTGFATGYYLGTRAGRQRYDQINRQLARLRRSDAFEEVAERAKSAVEEGVEKARSLVESRAGNGNGFGPEDVTSTAPGTVTGTGTTEPPPGLAGYSSSK